MAIERLTKHDIKTHVMILLRQDGIKHFHDGRWRKYEAVIEFGRDSYQVKCEYVLRDVFLTYKNLVINKLDQTYILN